MYSNAKRKKYFHQFWKSECKRSVNFYEINLASKKNDTDVEIQLARLQHILFCHKMSQYFGLVLSVNWVYIEIKARRQPKDLMEKDQQNYITACLHKKSFQDERS